MNTIKTIVILLIIGLITNYSNAEETKDSVLKRGMLNCGVSQGNPGFSSFNISDNKWRGIDVDVCRAVAAAVLGDADKVNFSQTSGKTRFEVLKAKDIDLLVRTTTYTLTRDASLGVEYAGINFYDGQGFTVRKSSKITSVKQLKNASICVETGTTTELNMRDYFNANKIKYTPIVFESQEEIIRAYDSGRCDSYSSDKSQLTAHMQKLKNPNDHVILKETISKEPWGPVVRSNEELWENIVRWSLYVMIEAEEYGVTSENIDSFKNTKNPNIKRLLGIESNTGKLLGLSDLWSYHIIKQVGNYQESFEKNLGSRSKFKLDRGINKLWSQGGILYVPPVR